MPDALNGPVKIHYEISGSGPALLLLPGLGVDSRDLRAMIDLLAADWTVIAVDNRGAGRSDKPDEPYTIELMAADALCVLDAAGLEHVAVLGYSMGGRIALQLALANPSRVERLILLATGARTIATTRRRLLFAISPYLPVGPKPRQPVYAFKRQRAASEAYDARERVGFVTAPTLIVHGRSDGVAPPKLAEELHAGISGSRIEWYDGGHITPMFKPNLVADAIRSFVR